MEEGLRDEPLPAACPNCGATLVGPFCHGCGQDNRRTRLTTRRVLSDGLRNLVGWESRLGRTVRGVFINPGRVAWTYVEGGRASLVNPARLCLLSLAAWLVVGRLLGIDPTDLAGINVTSSSGGPRVAEALKGFLGRNLDLLLYASMPVQALALRVAFKRSGRNFAEALVFALFLASARFLLALALLPLALVSLQSERVLRLGFYMVWGVVGARHFFAAGTWASTWRFVLSVLVHLICTILLAAVVAVGWSVMGGIDLAAPELNAILAQASRASGAAQLNDAARGADPGVAPGAIRVGGTSVVQGTPARFALTFDAGGRYRREIDGRLASQTVWDGERLWEVRNGTGPYELELTLRELELLRAWVTTGFWALPEAPLVIERADEPAPDAVALRLRLAGGRVASTLLLDSKTYLPRTLVQDGGPRVEFGRFESFDGLCLPRDITIELGPGGRASHEVTTVERVGTDDASFARPADPGTTHFDPRAPEEVELRVAPSGHALVKALVDGQDVGWFLFDTGAGFSGLSPAVGDELDLLTFGSAALSGVGGSAGHGGLRRAATLQLGPLTIDGPLFTETRAGARLGRIDGREVAGVLGFDVLARAVVELDLAGGTLRLRDPSLAAPVDTDWTELVVHYQVPYVRATFEGERAGLFMLDTGAGSRSVVFFGHSTAALDMLANRETTPSTARGAGGTVETRLGRLAWIRFAGRTFREPDAAFIVGDDGEADPYSYGLVGGGLLEPFRVVLDYPHRRVAFVPR